MGTVFLENIPDRQARKDVCGGQQKVVKEWRFFLARFFLDFRGGFFGGKVLRLADFDLHF